MRKALTSATLVLAIVLLWGAVPGAKAAEQLSIEAFYGNFQGSGIARTDASDYFGLTLRDFDVTIRPEGSGISISWTTVLRQGGDPDNPDVRRKSNSLTFVPSDLPGVYRATHFRRRSGGPAPRLGLCRRLHPHRSFPRRARWRRLRHADLSPHPFRHGHGFGIHQH